MTTMRTWTRARTKIETRLMERDGDDPCLDGGSRMSEKGIDQEERERDAKKEEKWRPSNKDL